MTEKKSRRVVIINNIDSENIDQAIFILKSSSQKEKASRSVESNIAAEAQQIIDNYIRQVDRIKESDPSTKAKPEKSSQSKKLLFFAFITVCLLCIGVSLTLISHLG